MWERSIILPNLQNNALIDKACTKKSFVCHQTKLDFSWEYLPGLMTLKHPLAIKQKVIALIHR